MQAVDPVAIFVGRLKAATESHGAAAELCRKAEISRTTFENWVTGKATPKLEHLAGVSSAMDKEPWQLLYPGDAFAKPPVSADRHEKEVKALRDRITEVEEENKGLKVAVTSIAGRLADLVLIASKLDDDRLHSLTRELRVEMGIEELASELPQEPGVKRKA